MVHDLQTLRKLNAEASRKGGKTGTVSNLPRRIGFNPLALREFLNRPWTKAELGRQPDVYKSYAASAAEPFNRKGKIEGLRT